MTTNNVSASVQADYLKPILRLRNWLLETLACPDLNSGYYPLAFTNPVGPDCPRLSERDED